jgi:hypothetical protein
MVGLHLICETCIICVRFRSRVRKVSLGAADVLLLLEGPTQVFYLAVELFKVKAGNTAS